MRIVSWNMNQQGGEAWDFLLGTLQPDIALLQEAIIPAGLDGRYKHLWAAAGDGWRWGSAILSRVSELTLDWEDYSQGAVLLVQSSLPSLGPLSIACVHARVTRNRVIPGLRKTFDSLRQRLRERFIVGGDLNTARAAARQWPAYGHGEFWADLEASGFVEPLPLGTERQSYWREWRWNKPPTIGNSLQDDHVLFDAETIQQVSRCRIWDTKRVRELSDHGPVVVDLRVSAPR